MPEAPSIPLTRHTVSAARMGRIREAVRHADTLPGADGGSRAARVTDAEALTDFLLDPAIHAPIYSLPRPLDLRTVTAFIQAHLAEQDRGEGLLFVSFFDDGRVAGYSDIQVWPQWATGELGGALHPERQSRGQGLAGAARSFDWMFQTLGLERICETAAMDNVRTAKLLDALGFERMGEVVSRRADGSPRPSRVWEIDRAAWRHGAAERRRRVGGTQDR